MAHLMGPPQIHPGMLTIGQRQLLAVVEAGVALQLIQPRQYCGIHLIQLTEGAAFADHRHGKGAQIMEHQAWSFDLPHPAGALEPVVVAFTPLERAIDEHQQWVPCALQPSLFPGWVPAVISIRRMGVVHRPDRAACGTGLIMTPFRPVPMTIALLLTLVGSLALMVYIVKRLERA